MKYHIDLDIPFRKNPYKGLYIALEGVDGSGKTTQVKALQQYFEKKGKKVTVTSEPKVDLPGGEDIMKFFKGEVAIPGQAFQYWMSANRVINHESIVLPALERGNIVLSDRCFWSAVPYGIMDNGSTFSRKATDLMLLTQSILSQYYQFVVPDIIFYIDISPEVGLERSLSKKERKSENDVYERKDKLEIVVRGYRWLVKEFTNMFTQINGENSIDDITIEMLEIIQKRTHES